MRFPCDAGRQRRIRFNGQLTTDHGQRATDPPRRDNGLFLQNIFKQQVRQHGENHGEACLELNPASVI